MNHRSLLILLLVFFTFCLTESPAQKQFTIFDDLPGIIRSYKPAFSEDLPAWGKMLYHDTVNYAKLCRDFEAYTRDHPGERSAIIRYFRMWQRVVGPFVTDDGSVSLPDAAEFYSNLLNSQISAKASFTKSTEGNSAWSFLGPKETYWLNESGSPSAPGSCPWQANVYSLDVASSDVNVIYCGTETGFVNKTLNKGVSWQQQAIGYPFGGGVTAIAIHPTDANVVYAAAGNQLHKTVDGGQTWTPLLQLGGLFYADRLRIDPADPLKIYAASSTGLFVSANAGNTWTKKWATPVYDVEIRPGANAQVMALTKNNGKFSVIESTDGGTTFTTQASFPTNITETSGGLLAMTAANPNMILAILLSASNTPYLLKATASGTSWTWTLLATGNSGPFPMDNGQGYFDLVLDISPLNENIILVGTTTLYKSLNGGTSFSAVGGYSGSFNIHPDIQDIRMLPNGETWVSTDGGMNLTTDNFGLQSNYQVRVSGLTGSDFWGFDQGWNEDIVVGGRYHNGNTSMASFYQPKALRMGGAESPTGWVLQGRSRRVAFNDLGNGWVLPQTAEGKPEGRFIFSKYPNMDEYGGRRSNLVHHPLYYGTLFLGEENSFWRSSDMGVTWDLLHQFAGRVRYLQISYSNPDVIYADIVGAGLYRSSDGGLTWTLKPSLTSAPYGNSNWKGKLFLAISPYDSEILYACLQNGTWSADIGKVFRSADGGDTWEEWTGSLSEYLKCMVIQPASDDKEVVYLFTNSTNGKPARVFYRKPGMTDWVLFSNGYPAGMVVNMALPFYRDGKLRVAGNAGVWESPMYDTLFKPIIMPWIEKAHYNCMTDTLFFDDHSILNHEGASWHWEITPQPAWIDNADIRNPKVVPGSPGSFDVTMKVTRNGTQYSETIAGMVTASTCPSIYDCDNPAELPKDIWRLVYVDSEEVNDPGFATMSFDGDPSTIWHTRWSTGSDPYPHEIQVDLGGLYSISRFTCLNRQDGENGRIRDYELYISEDTLNWGNPVRTGQFANTAAPQTIIFDTAVTGRYFRLLALSEVNGNPWASAAEFTLVGCVDYPAGSGIVSTDPGFRAFPVPTSGEVAISVPAAGPLHYSIFSTKGSMVEQGNITVESGSVRLNISSYPAGVYIIRLDDGDGRVYRVRVARQ